VSELWLYKANMTSPWGQSRWPCGWWRDWTGLGISWAQVLGCTTNTWAIYQGTGIEDKAAITELVSNVSVGNTQHLIL